MDNFPPPPSQTYRVSHHKCWYLKVAILTHTKSEKKPDYFAIHVFFFQDILVITSKFMFLYISYTSSSATLCISTYLTLHHEQLYVSLHISHFIISNFLYLYISYTSSWATLCFSTYLTVIMSNLIYLYIYHTSSWAALYISTHITFQHEQLCISAYIILHH